MIIVLALAGYVALGVTALFVHLERRDRAELAVAAVVLTLVLQALLYPGDGSVPVGILRPGPLRLGEVLLGAAVAARLWVRGRSIEGRLIGAGVAWTAFLTWYATSGIMGALGGNERAELLFQAKLLLHAGGGYLLARGVKPGRLADGRVIGWTAPVLGAGVALQVVSSLLDRPFLGRFPGPVGPDGASLYIALALVFVVTEAVRQRPRAWVFASAVPLVIAPAVVEQRASLLHLAVTAAVVLLVGAGRTMRRRMSVTGAHVAIAFAFIVVVAAAATLPNVARGDTAPSAVTETVEGTFGGIGNEQSADARLLKWEVGNRLIADRTILGWGLGLKFTSFRPGIKRVGVFSETGVFDNIYYDLWARSGIIGLALFVIAMLLSIRAGLEAWRRHTDDTTAGLALAGALFLIGYAAKGAVESVNDKVLLSCMLGVVVGAIGAAQAESGQTNPASARADHGVEPAVPRWS
jgi:O-antigen ligase